MEPSLNCPLYIPLKWGYALLISENAVGPIYSNRKVTYSNYTAVGLLVVQAQEAPSEIRSLSMVLEEVNDLNLPLTLEQLKQPSLEEVGMS
ncbi:UNVERIFIED_CONTAM: hypothetical protein K2H54_042468 [Gekko kuhli]